MLLEELRTLAVVLRRRGVDRGTLSELVVERESTVLQEMISARTHLAEVTLALLLFLTSFTLLLLTTTLALLLFLFLPKNATVPDSPLSAEPDRAGDDPIQGL